MLTSSITPWYQSPDALGFPPRINGAELEIDPTFPPRDVEDPSTVSVMPDDVFLQTMVCQLPFERSGPALTDRLPLVPWNLQKACPEPRISIL